MGNSLKKRGQKFLRKFSRASVQAGTEGKEHIKENLFERVSHIHNVRLLILEWGLLITALIMLALTQAFWFSTSYAEDTFVSGGSYTEATIGRVNSLNPLFATTSSEKTLSSLMFATLTTDDYSGHVGLGLVDYLRASEDGKVWTIKLRDGLVWSDGEPIDNSDVLFTIGLIQNPAVNTIYDSNLEKVSIKEGENGEIIFSLPSAYADFASALKIPIVPRHILENVPVKTLVENEFSLKPVTSGAFSFNATQVAGTNETVYYLSANPYYYKGQPLLNSFAVHTYENKTDIVAAINSNTITASAELAATDVNKITSGGYNIRETGINSGAFMFLNMGNGPLKSGTLRMALRQGLNMEEIRAAAPNTMELNYPLISSQIALSSYPELAKYNFADATNRVAEINKTTPVHLNVVTVNSGYLPAVAEKIVEQLKLLGIEATLTTYEESQEFVTNIIAKRNYDILVYEIELGSDPDPLPYYHSSQAGTAGLNLSNYRNTLVDDLLIGARETLDTTLRARKYETFLEYWASDTPAIGLYQANLTYVYNKNARTYGESIRLVTGLDRLGDVEDWAATKGARNLTP